MKNRFPFDKYQVYCVLVRYWITPIDVTHLPIVRYWITHIALLIYPY